MTSCLFERACGLKGLHLLLFSLDLSHLVPVRAAGKARHTEQIDSLETSCCSASPISERFAMLVVSRRIPFPPNPVLSSIRMRSGKQDASPAVDD